MEIMATTGFNVNLTNCDREPIHVPGSIQPHGLLMVLTEPDFQIVQISENATDFLGIPPEDLLDRALVELIGSDRIRAVQACLGRLFEQTNPIQLTIAQADGTARMCNGIVHRTLAGQVVLELEPLGVSVTDISDSFRQLKRILVKIQGINTLSELCDLIVNEVRQITGCDRVMIYRFNQQGDGSVIAEAKQPYMEAFLGLHYPHSDVPQQARNLYTLNWLRLLKDVNMPPVGLLASSQPDNAAPPEPLDMSYCTLRSISPIHREYLQNMGVAASMSISIMQQKHLWGLIACHHDTPKFIPYEIRTICEVLGHLMSSEIANQEANETLDYRLHLQTTQARLIDSLVGTTDFVQALEEAAADVLQLVNAQGFAVCEGGRIALIGNTPEESDIVKLLAWLEGDGDAHPQQFDQDQFVTAALPQIYPPATTYKDVASGLLAVVISKTQHRYLLWFRPELLKTVTWAGDPNKPKQIEADGSITLTPRQSFAAWQETVRLQSPPWLRCEVTGAIALKDAIIEIVLLQADELAAINLELERSSAELSSFACVSSHNLQEPLRKIQTLGNLLRTHCGDTLDETSQAYLRRLLEASTRAQTLVDNLLTFSRVTAKAQPFKRVNVRHIIERVLADLEMRIEQSGGQVIVGEIPDIDGDVFQIRQLFQHLLSNAFKFTRPGILPKVTVTAIVEGDEVHINVADNGVGFDAKSVDQIFQVFRRPSSYSPNETTGIGLAICRKIVECHHGTLTATGVPDQGASFIVSLPLRQNLGSSDA
jgi:two-component system, chemotaxis family, sensor kinase Cph1